MRRKQIKAFTLIEMIIVLFIIGMLMLIFVPNLTKKGEVAKSKSDIAIAKVVQQEVELYKAEHDGKAPEDIAELVGEDRAKIYEAHKAEVQDEFTSTSASGDAKSNNHIIDRKRKRLNTSQKTRSRIQDND